MLLRTTVVSSGRAGWFEHLRVRLLAQRPHLAVVAGLVVLALVQQPGTTTFDTKLDLTENPWGFLDRALSLWNPQANFGELQNQAYGYLFPVGPFFAVGKSLGLPGWAVQGLWASLLLVVAYLGVVAMCRALPVGTGWSRVIAGLAYALCPRVVTTLGPISTETLIVAVLPWTIVPLLRWQTTGLRRAAALSSLGVLCMGAVNATATLAVLPLTGLILVTRPRAVRRRLAAWWAGCLALACAWWAIPLVLLGKYSPAFLDYIESASNTTSGIGLAESLRGATHWVAGVVVGGQPWWPAGHQLVSADWLVVTTTVVGVAGLVALLGRRVPSRTALLGSAVLGLIVLALGWDGPLASPFGSVWNELLDGPLAPFRNVHKFDPLVRLPVAVGLAHGMGVIVRSLRRERSVSARRVAGVAGVVALAASSIAPSVLGISPGLRPGGGWDELPQWWREAADYVAERDPRARTLVLPSSGFATQIWGRTIDEPLQPLASAPWASRSKVYVGSEGAARMLETVDGWMESGRGSPVLGDALARAGIRFVVLRADLDRRASGSPPVAVVRQALERSGGISSVARFGPTLGGGGAAGLRVSGFGLDASTPAIEVYEVDASVPVARLHGLDDLVGVHGGPESVPRLVADGLLEPNEPAVLAIDEPEGLQRWVVTDDLTRRERNFGRTRENLGPVRTADEPPRQVRAATDLLPARADGHQTVARYVGIEGVTASSSRGYADSIQPTNTALSPWSALDGDPFTAWRSDSGGEPTGEWIRVDFDEARLVDEISVHFADPGLVGPPVSAVDVRTEAGVARSVVRGDGSAESLRVESGWTDFVEVEVAAVGASIEGEVGILELELRGVDTERVVVAPSDQSERNGRPAAAEGFSFHRLDATRGACVIVGFSTRCDPSLPVRGDEATGLVRAFATSLGASYLLEGTALPRPGTAVQRLLEPLGGIRAAASSTLGGDPGVAGARAVDGNPATSWVADSFDSLPTLRLEWSDLREVSGFRVVSSQHPVAARPTEVTVEIDGVRRDLDVAADGWVRFPEVRADRLAVTVTRWGTVRSVDPVTGATTAAPPGVAELEIPGLEDLVVFPDLDASTGRWCGSGPTLEVDGVQVPTQVDGTIRDVFENRSLRWSACGEAAAGIDLPVGQHTIEVRADEMFVADTAVLLRSDEAGSRIDRPGGVEVVHWGSTQRRVRVTTEEAALLVVPENQSAGWVAVADGESLPSVRVDGWQQGWELPAGFDGEVDLVFTPQSTFEGSLALGAVGAGALLGLVGIRSRRTDASARSVRARSTNPGIRQLAAFGAAAVLGTLLAGVVGAVAFVLAMSAFHLPVRRFAYVVVAAAAVAVLGVSLSVGLSPGPAETVRSWAALPVVAVVGGAALRAFLGVRRMDAARITVGTAVARWRRLPIWVQLAHGLIVLQLGWRAWSLSNGYFWLDDFIYVHQASHGLSLEFLFQDYQGHVMPGQFLLVWLLTMLAPLSWAAAAGLVVVLQLVASLLVLRLVRALAGDGSLSFAVFAVYVLSPLAFTASMWWASALQSLPMQICMAWALGAHLRYLRTGSGRALVMTGLAVLVGLLFWQKALLIPMVLVGFTVLVGPTFTGRPAAELIRRTWAVLVGYTVVAVAYGVGFVMLAEQDSSGIPSPRELWDLFRFTILDTFVPGMFGIIGGAEPAAPLLAPEPSMLVSLVSWEVLAIGVVATLVVARWSAARAWLLLLAYLLVDVALVATSRLDFVGPVIGRDPRYTADAVLVAVVALAAVGVAVRAHRERMPGPMWSGRAFMSTASVLVLVNTSLISTFGVVERLPMDEARVFVTNAREAAGRPGGVDLVDGPVPSSVIARIFTDRARASVVVEALPEEPRFGQPTHDLRMLDGFGSARPVDIRPVASASPKDTSSCSWPVRSVEVDIPLDSTVPPGRWIVRLGYYGAHPTSGRLGIDGRSHDVQLLGGVHYLYLELSTSKPIRSISIGDLPTGDAVCVTDVVVGTGWPRQDG